ncbi:hypothetical protein, partial [Enterobacter hormaechei]|uniref:hypothetical protein n=1 Tax=Enterobacter hormaechei TaxID=158836 RepID=UPI001C2777E5
MNSSSIRSEYRIISGQFLARYAEPSTLTESPREEKKSLQCRYAAIRIRSAEGKRYSLLESPLSSRMDSINSRCSSVSSSSSSKRSNSSSGDSFWFFLFPVAILTLELLGLILKWFTEFGHLNRGDMLTSEQHRCHN